MAAFAAEAAAAAAAAAAVAAAAVARRLRRSLALFVGFLGAAPARCDTSTRRALSALGSPCAALPLLLPATLITATCMATHTQAKLGVLGAAWRGCKAALLGPSRRRSVATRCR